MTHSRLHFMGIGGQGISAVAQMAQLAGDIVTGCDAVASATTRALQQVGIEVQIGHSPEHLVDADALIHVPAAMVLNPNNPELVAAKASGMEVITWQEMLGRLMQGKCVLSVSGVHGKGTTTAMLALMLIDAGFDPTVEIGAIVPRFGANYRLGKSRYFVNEADEYYHNFWHYHPRLAIVTSIEFEHPEFFANYTDYLAAFEHFIQGMDSDGNWSLPLTLILNADSPGCMELRQRLESWPGQILTYSVEGKDQTDFQAYDMKLNGKTTFRVRARSDESFLADTLLSLQLPGTYNVSNALAALSAAHSAGVSAEVIVKTLEDFRGIRRRFEIRHSGPLAINGEMLDSVLVDDYAHHPTAIATILEAARRRYPERRLVAVYQPHMFSRTKTFFEQFLSAFNSADVVIISDIFPAREQDTGIVHARDLVEALAKGAHFSQPNMQVMYGGDVQATAKLLRSSLRSGDLVLIMGAGDIYNVTETLLEEGYSQRVTPQGNADDIRC